MARPISSRVAKLNVDKYDKEKNILTKHWGPSNARSMMIEPRVGVTYRIPTGRIRVVQMGSNYMGKE